MRQLNLLTQKSKLLEVSLEASEKLIFSYSDYPIFLPNPQLLLLILDNFRDSILHKTKNPYPIWIGVFKRKATTYSPT
jgi:hypothetical protein